MQRNKQQDRLAEETLELMPRGVRDKLDRIGIKLHLKDWQAFDLTERRLLRDLPCATEAEAVQYAAEVRELLMRRTGREPEAISR